LVEDQEPKPPAAETERWPRPWKPWKPWMRSFRRSVAEDTETYNERTGSSLFQLEPRPEPESLGRHLAGADERRCSSSVSRDAPLSDFCLQQAAGHRERAALTTRPHRGSASREDALRGISPYQLAAPGATDVSTVAPFFGDRLSLVVRSEMVSQDWLVS
jgi:hypothetical protein